MNGTTLLLNFSEPLDTAVSITSSTFDVYIDGSEVSYTVPTTAYSKSNTSITLTLDSAAPSTDSSITIDYSSDIIQDTAFVANKLVPFSGSTVINSTTSLPPVITSSFVDYDGESVTVIFSEPLDPSINLTNSSLVDAGSFVSGTQYVISSAGNTDFTSLGASSNAVGTTFVASAAGSGTGSAINLELLIYESQGWSKLYSCFLFVASYTDNNSAVELTLSSSVDYQAYLRVIFRQIQFLVGLWVQGIFLHWCQF